MAQGLITKSYLSDIADAIRGKNGSSDTYTPSEMASAITNIPTGTVILKRGVLRPDAESVKTWTYDKYLNADEKIEIPAYTTTSTTLIAAASLTPTYTCDWTNYNYYVSIRMATIPEYSISTKGKGREEYALNSCFYEITETPKNTIHAIITPTTKYTSDLRAVYSAGNLVREVYWSSGTAITAYGSAAYGYNQAVTAPSISGTTFTAKSPAFIVRGNTTYFTTTYMSAVTDVRYQYIIELYRAPKNNYNYDGWGLVQQWLKMNEDILSSTHKLT